MKTLNSQNKIEIQPSLLKFRSFFQTYVTPNVKARKVPQYYFEKALLINLDRQKAFELAMFYLNSVIQYAVKI